MNTLLRVDRGNRIEDNVDDTLPVSFQQAIRSFSPRPVRHPYANQDEESSIDDAPRITDKQWRSGWTRDGVFLGVRQSSPFQVTFTTSSDKTNSDELSYISKPFVSQPAVNLRSSEPPNPDDGTGPMPTSSDFSQGPSNMRFRLTPLTIPPTVAVDPPKSSNEWRFERCDVFPWF